MGHNYCKYSHEYTVENTRYDKYGNRYCNTCKRINARKRINFRGFEYKTGNCKYGHNIESHYYVRNNGTIRCGICALNTSQRRRDRKVNLDTNYSLQDQKLTRILFHEQCFKCEAKEHIEIDHHYPLSLGFSLSKDNAVLLCKSCNTSKNNTLPEYFYTQDELNRIDYLLSLTLL